MESLAKSNTLICKPKTMAQQGLYVTMLQVLMLQVGRIRGSCTSRQKYGGARAGKVATKPTGKGTLRPMGRGTARPI